MSGERAGEIRIEEWRCLGHDRIVIGSEEVFVFHGAAMLGVDLEGEGLLLFVAQDGDLHGLAHVGAEGAVPVGGGHDGIGADLEDHVEGFEAGGRGFALARHLLDHETARNTEVVGHLRGERLNQRAHVEAAGEDGHVEAAGRHGRVTAGHDAHGRQRRNGRNAACIDADLVPNVVLHDFAVGQLHGQGLDVAVAADFEADLAAGRNFAEHAPQLLGALDVLAVDRENHVIDFEPDLAGGRVVIDERDECAAHFLELERLRFVGIDIGDIDAEITRGGGVGREGAGISKRLASVPAPAHGLRAARRTDRLRQRRMRQNQDSTGNYGTASKGASWLFLPVVSIRPAPRSLKDGAVAGKSCKLTESPEPGLRPAGKHSGFADSRPSWRPNRAPGGRWYRPRRAPTN